MPTKTKSKAVCALFLARIVSSSLAAIEHFTKGPTQCVRAILLQVIPLAL